MWHTVESSYAALLLLILVMLLITTVFASLVFFAEQTGQFFWGGSDKVGFTACRQLDLHD
jgi:hypothetical protein